MFSRITSHQRIPADSEHVDEHLYAVAQHAHFRGRRMPPAHRNLHGAQAMVARQIQKFRVEPKALDPLLLENDFARIIAEGLESALRIDKWQPQDDANNLVENDAGEFTERRFMDADQTAVHGARTNGYVKFLQRARKDPRR